MRLHDTTAQLRDLADGVIAAGLRTGGKSGKALDEAYDDLRIAANDAYPTHGAPNRAMLDGILDAGLSPTVESDNDRWQPLHWVLELPDVFDRDGFDAVIGNPPFLGGSKLTGAMGTPIRDWLVNIVAAGRRGNADLVSYFFLRATSLLQANGTLGLIATNTLAQGDTREVGLDAMVADGFTITRAIQSRSWPAASANLEYAAVWGTRHELAEDVPRFADEVAVRRISTLLEPEGRVQGKPLQLDENKGIVFEGCKLHGMGFILSPDEAHEWIALDHRNAEVLFPYLNGEDLNSRPDNSASRWVIDFNDRSEEESAKFSLPFRRVYEDVRPERLTNNRRVYRDIWWQFAERRPALRAAIDDVWEVWVIAVTSKSVMPVRVSQNHVFSNTVDVFATDDFGAQAVLSSSLHQIWAITYGSGMRSDPRYTPSDVFETFPRPSLNDALVELGRTFDAARRAIMLRRGLGLTKLYNLVNDPEVTAHADSDVGRMRALHVELDSAVLDAYGWGDVQADHGFHSFRRMLRWTVGAAARAELLDRLLEENHRRALDELQHPLTALRVDDDEENERLLLT